MTTHKPLRPRLIVLTDFAQFPHSMDQLKLLCEDVAPGQLMLVLRDRNLSVRQRLVHGRELRAVTRKWGHSLVVVDRFDLAEALEAEGVHLGTSAVLPSRIRERVRWLSRAAHGTERVSADELVKLDALLVSPAFADLKGRAALGIDGLKASRCLLKRQVRPHRVPELYALGRVDASNAVTPLSLGYQGVACIGAALDPRARPQLIDALEIGRASKTERPWSN